MIRAYDALARVAFFLMFSIVIWGHIGYAATEVPAGEVSGIWTRAGTPYRINGPITVPDGATLTIEPGVTVLFMGHFTLKVQGSIKAVGTPQDSIVFTAHDTLVGWHGVQLWNIPSENDSSIFEFTVFEYGKANTGKGLMNRCGGAILSSTSKLRLSHCLLQYNLAFHSNRALTGGGAMAIVGGNPLIEFTEFRKNSSPFGSALTVWKGSQCTIRNSRFSENTGHGTINVGARAIPVLVNNIIANNYSTGHGLLHFSNGSGGAVVMHNTIVYNTSQDGGTIFIADGSAPVLFNCILYGNTPGHLYLNSASELQFLHCLIEGGRSAFADTAFSGRYEHCLDARPEFVGPNDFHLQAVSPCIRSGADSARAGNIWFRVSPSDFSGHPRPSPAHSSPDIGAFEHPE